ncbi:hypothetical protein GCK72_004580 [Caenorhabditis remanei]|uniref:F-box domain-containing protein n=2 Tax=Caenorhabditis remanei TaxID=31234 RepID=A0A6A5HCJ4_CAERE|nr:hypothetical protein GCK72_004580 [Caenorhabditis remanei]KAF1764631.1 hypothetical protein GCK72_004580 [Caenorhabditis remanei]
MPSAFPLLRLPDNVQRKVVNGFDAVQLINFSLLSNNAKQLARSLNITMDILSLRPNDNIEIDIRGDDASRNMRWTFYPPKRVRRFLWFKRPKRGSHSVYMPGRVEAKLFNWAPRDTVVFQNPGLSISSWLKQFQDVYHNPGIVDIQLEKAACIFDMESIKDTVQGMDVNALSFTEDCGVKCAQLAFRSFPEAKILHISSTALSNPDEYQNMLIQNLDGLAIIKKGDLKISLDQILLINSATVFLSWTHITDKLINRYLKHWIQGSNPRMENIRIAFEPNHIFDKDMILKGLKFRRCLPYLKKGFEGMKTYGFMEFGFEIRRKDGTEGMIAFENDDNSRYFIFHVFT